MEDAPSPIPSYLASILRSALGMAGGWLIGKGYITADQSPELIGGALAVLTVVWGLVQKHSAHKALTRAIDAPAGSAG